MSKEIKIESFSIIGLGKVGKIFTHIFKERLKFKLDYIIDKNEKVNFLGSKILNKIPNKIDSDLIIISTPDDNILDIINLLNSKHSIKKDVIYLHFSGALYIKQENIVSIHPMMSITSYKNDLNRLKEHYFTLQSDNLKLLKIFDHILKQISPNYLIINGKDKKYFHLSAVIINNFSTALVKSSIQIIKKIGLNENEALNILLPLFKDVFINLETNLNVDKSLTGPIIRNDIETIKKHIKLLKTNQMIDEKAIYDVFLTYIRKKF
jgi:predicted short-subunit dehydrogenase-like oxidoreductase (DUF2520 family)